MVLLLRLLAREVWVTAAIRGTRRPRVSPRSAGDIDIGGLRQLTRNG